MIVLMGGSTCGTIGGGAFEKEVIQAALNCFESRKDSSLNYDQRHAEPELAELICGDRLHVKLQYFSCNDLAKILSSIQSQEEVRLIIFGAGAISKALAQQANFIGLATTIVDDRMDYCNTRRFPHSYCRAIDSFSRLPILCCNDNDLVVIATSGRADNRQCLKWALESPAQFIGLLGSKRQNDMTFNDLVEQEGIDPEQYDRIHCPVGLDIGAESPEEIAVAIISEIIMHRSFQKRTKKTSAHVCSPQVSGINMPPM